jgi:hypothetical protein
MNSMAPIAFMNATDATRRAVRGAGPDDAAVPERPRRRLAAPRSGPSRPAAAQSGSDQCNIVAVPRKPARA